jgi:hypothetical protein
MAFLAACAMSPSGGGPYPGDTGTYSFKLYGNRGLTKGLGSAVSRALSPSASVLSAPRTSS